MSRYNSLPYRSLWLEEQDVSNEDAMDLREEMRTLAVHLRAAKAARIPLVYAVLRHELPVVKIGVSRNLSGRDGRLRRMPGCRLVAVVQGGRDVERSIHTLLSESRTTVPLRGYGTSEHFRLTPEVVDWVNEARSRIGLARVDLAAVAA